MEMSLFKRDGKTFTRFKIKVKELEGYLAWLKLYGVDTSKPVEKNSRFIYFEKEGDWINGIL